MVGRGGQAAEAEVTGNLGEGGRVTALLLLPADEVENLLQAAGEWCHTVCNAGISRRATVNGKLFMKTSLPGWGTQSVLRCLHHIGVTDPEREFGLVLKAAGAAWR